MFNLWSATQNLFNSFVAWIKALWQVIQIPFVTFDKWLDNPIVQHRLIVALTHGERFFNQAFKYTYILMIVFMFIWMFADAGQSLIDSLIS